MCEYLYFLFSITSVSDRPYIIKRGSSTPRSLYQPIFQMMGERKRRVGDLHRDIIP